MNLIRFILGSICLNLEFLEDLKRGDARQNEMVNANIVFN